MFDSKFIPRSVIRAGLVAMTAITVITASGGIANAAPGGPFLNQALRAGLSATQAKVLQAEVDGYVAEYKGKQVSANQVEFPGGRITVALPGEKIARTLSDNIPACWEGISFCVYEHALFWGTVFSQWQCNKYIDLPMSWYQVGSWRNTQSPGTAALLYDKNWQLNYVSWAYEQQADWNLAVLGHVDPC
jgi:hypothetical protein